MFKLTPGASFSIFVFQRGTLTFYDVNFAANRPWTGLAQRPKGRPGTATRRHVLEIEHGYRVVVSGLGRYADTVASTRGRVNEGRIIRTHEKRPVLHFGKQSARSPKRTRVNHTIGQVFASGLSLADVVDATVRWVRLGLPIPSLVKRVAYPLILEIKVRPDA